MPFLFVLIFGIVLERKKFPEIGKVARNRKVAETLPSILWTALIWSLGPHMRIRDSVSI